MAEPMVKRCHDGEYNITVDDIEGATSLALWDREPLDLEVVEALFDATKDDRRPSRICNFLNLVYLLRDKINFAVRSGNCFLIVPLIIQPSCLVARKGNSQKNTLQNLCTVHFVS